MYLAGVLLLSFSCHARFKVLHPIKQLWRLSLACQGIAHFVFCNSNEHGYRNKQIMHHLLDFGGTSAEFILTIFSQSIDRSSLQNSLVNCKTNAVSILAYSTLYSSFVSFAYVRRTSLRLSFNIFIDGNSYCIIPIYI